MSRALMIFAFAMPCLFITACKEQNSPQGASLSIDIQRDAIVDFHQFLEALKLLATDQTDSPVVIVNSGTRKLAFRSSRGYPGSPLLIHVSPTQVAVGSGPSRESLTIDELQKRLTGYADAASKANSEGIVLLISDRKVSGDFALVILNAIADSGIPTVMLSDSDLPEVPVVTPSKKPSSPSSPFSKN